MKRFLFNFFFILVASLSGVGMFLLKYEVIAKENELYSFQRQIKENQREYHILKAEWAHLTDPDRLRTLIKSYTALDKVKPNQVTTFEKIFFADVPLPLRKPDIILLTMRE